MKTNPKFHEPREELDRAIYFSLPRIRQYQIACCEGSYESMIKLNSFPFVPKRKPTFGEQGAANLSDCQQCSRKMSIVPLQDVNTTLYEMAVRHH